MRARLHSLLCGRAGASLPFVLAIMMLLTAVGVSALAAAAAASGAGTGKQIENQLVLYADSLHQSLLYSLQKGDAVGTDIDQTKSLGGQLMNVLYDKANADNNGAVNSYQIQVDDVKLDSNPFAKTCTLTITVQPHVTIYPTYNQTNISFDSEGNRSETIARIPQEATLSADVTIRSDINYHDKKLLAASRFAYSSGLLQDNGSSTDTMLIQNPGDWRFVSYDKVDR